MKYALTPMILTALIFTGTPAFADDMKSDSMASQHKQMMKDCMARQKAQDSSMSEHAMKSACKAEMKAKMDSDKMDSSHMGQPGVGDSHPDGNPPKQ
jgi:hypothetical protein